uniref:Uncharacterized protein n=1 Tax=Kalanchoe fedtschenkoi TaxID=63787 RepID=A0A7N0U7Y9_KALFE
MRQTQKPQFLDPQVSRRRSRLDSELLRCCHMSSTHCYTNVQVFCLCLFSPLHVTFVVSGRVEPADDGPQSYDTGTYGRQMLYNKLFDD